MAQELVEERQLRTQVEELLQDSIRMCEALQQQQHGEGQPRVESRAVQTSSNFPPPPALPPPEAQPGLLTRSVQQLQQEVASLRQLLLPVVKPRHQQRTILQHLDRALRSVHGLRVLGDRLHSPTILGLSLHLGLSSRRKARTSVSVS